MLKNLLIGCCLLFSKTVFSQCSNFVVEDFDSFEYTTVCPYIIPNTTYQDSPQLSPGFGPSRTGNRHIYLNFADGYTGPAFDRPYNVCIGGTYRISFYHRDAWGGANNTTFNIYDANNVLLSSQTVPWNGTTWNHWVSPELTATTTTLRLEIVNNMANQGNNDMVIDDMSLEICSLNEQKVLLTCSLNAPVNLFDLFSPDMPTTGTWTGPATLGNGHLGTYDPASGVEGLFTYSISDPSLCSAPQGTVFVSGGSPIDLGDDVHFCTAQNHTLDAGTGYDFYNWSTGATTQTISVNTTGTYTVMAGKLGENLVLNGDFQGGTTAASNNFTSNYVPGTGGIWGLLSNPGQFAISTSPSLTHNNFSNCGDHTSGSGNMFIANGASTANTTVWSQTINVDPNQDYLFSFWAMNVTNDPNVSQLQLFVNGQPIGAPNTTLVTPCIWTEINDVWNSGGATQAVLSIVNQSTAEGGNDFAIDDIVFAPYCSFNDTINVSFGNHNLQLTANHTICQNNSTNLVAQATSTTVNNFTYHWSNIPDDISTQTVSPATTTTYTVYATGDDGCNTATRTVTVTVSPRPMPDAGADQIICIGDPISLTGTAASTQNARFWSHNITGVPVTPTMSYSPNTTSMTPTVTTNQPGIYLFILTEQNTACGVFKDTVQVLVSSTSQTVNTTELTCFGNNTGMIAINNPDGVNYSFDNGTTWVTNATQGGFAAGNYTVWSENQHGCRTSTNVTVTQPAPLSIITSNDTTICENGTAVLSATTPGINGSFFHWDHTADTQASQNVSPQQTTTYSVYAEDGNGCLSDTVSIIITLRNPLTGTISPYDTICPGYPTTIGVSGISGGLTPYSITWNSGENGTGNAMTISANPPQTYMYTVTITDICESTPLVLSTQVYVAPLPVPSMSSPDPAICEPASFTLVSTTDTAMAQSISWFISDGQFFIDQDSITTDPMPAGNYSVQMIVTSPLGCIDSITNVNYLTVYPLPVANFIWNPNPIKMFATDVNLINQSINGYSYEWTFEDGSILSSTLENPKVKFPEGITGQYEATLITTTEHGCKDTITKIIEVLPEVILYVPNTFTPDGDEFNQHWGIHIEGVDIYGFTMDIYNRWGERIWESKDPSETWDGTYNGKLVQEGTYTWSIQAKDRLNDARYTWNGIVNVLK